MTSRKVKNILERFGKMKQRKNTLLPMYRLISEYVYNKKFEGYGMPNACIFTDEDIYDNTAPRANAIMANVMSNNLWPNGPRTFVLRKTWDTSDTDEIKNYFEYVNKQLYSIMDNPRAGLQTALDEHMTDQGGYGISGIGVEEDDKDSTCPIRYKAHSVVNMCVDEGAEGTIDTIFSEKEMTLRTAVDIYGYDNLSAASRKLYDAGDMESKIKVLHAIEPRRDRDPCKFGSKDMPIASIHIDIQNEKILRESGFEEMPIFVGRFHKVLGEVYGRSPSMVAMPDILEANAAREAISIATEKQLDPPLAVYDDGALGGGVIDTSAGSINVFSVTGRINAGKPIEPLYTVGELQSTYNHLEELKETINNHYYLDRLLDFNNETRMTFGEAQLRNALRGQSLGAFYSRQIQEVITPLIQRTFNVALKRGLLGVVSGTEQEMEQIALGIKPRYIPDELVQKILMGEDVYDIDYISPAKRTMQSEELRGVMEVTNFALQTAGGNPEMLDNLDFDALIRRVATLSGTPEDIMRSMNEVKKIRDSRVQQQNELAELSKGREQSEIARNMAQAQVMQGGGNEQ